MSLHANVAIPARDRRRLERLCRYVARPPIATERLSPLPDGRLLYRLKHRWRDGTSHVVFEPLELIEKIAAVIPPPRAHLVRYHGVLAPAAHRRAQVVCDRAAATSSTPIEPAPAPEPALTHGPWLPREPGPRSEGGPSTPAPATIEAPDLAPTAYPTPPAPATDASPALGCRERRLSWADLMRRVFLVDVLQCPRCQGRMRLIAAIVQPELIARILTHRGLSARAPPTKPADPALLEAHASDLP